MKDADILKLKMVWRWAIVSTLLPGKTQGLARLFIFGNEQFVN
jgi:hypothetical protein